jgi:hypothetical protein
MGSAVHVVLSGASEARNVDILFLYSVGTNTDSTKNALGHITPNLCFCIWWDMWVT